jgi:hypothetical protein
VTQRDRDEATKWLYGAHLERWDLNGDPADRLAELLARVRADAESAMLLAAADIAREHLKRTSSPPMTIDWQEMISAIEALQSSDAAAALARRDAETRLEAANHVWELMYKAAWLGGAKSHKMDCICTGCEKLREAGNYVNALTRQLDEAKAPKDAR